MSETSEREAELLAEIARLEAELLRVATEQSSDHPTSAVSNRLQLFAPHIVEHLTDAVYVIASDGRIAYVNEVACQMLGYSNEEILKLTIFEIDPNLTPEIWTLVWGVTARDKKQTIETKHRAKDGRMIPVEVLANEIVVAGVRYSCSITHEITSRMKLEQRVRQAEKMEAIGQLAGGIAHDFNNQLAGIVGYAELLKSELGDQEELVSFADAVLMSATRSAELTRQLLTFARQGKNVFIPVDMHKIIAEVVQLLETTLDPRISIRTELGAQSAVTMGDASQLQNAVLNLAINARDAMPEGGTLLLSTNSEWVDPANGLMQSMQLGAGTYLKIAVSDTGSGMDAEVQRRMFEPFFTTKLPGKGTGMGLAVVHDTVKKHHGAIRVHSERGRGTSVELHLPLAVGLAHLINVVSEAAPTRRIEARVLLVEDDVAVRDMAVRMLTHLGCQVRAVACGKDAIACYREDCAQFDAVILDLLMPEMTGRDAFLALRQINPNAVVLLTSGYALDAEVQKIIDLGATAFIQKPFRISELSAKLLVALDRG